MIRLIEPTPPASGISGGYLYQREVGARLLAKGLGRLERIGALEEVQAPEAADALLLDGLWMEMDPEGFCLLAERHARTWILLHSWPSPTGEVALARAAAHLAGGVSNSLSVQATAERSANPAIRSLVRAVAVPGVFDSMLDRPRVDEEARRARGMRHLLCVGTLVPGKGQRELGLAVSRLRSEGRDWSLTLVGDPGVDPGYAAALRDSGDPEWLRIAGVLGEAEMVDAYDRHDLLVQPSHGESYGMATAEACARGLPVLVTATGDVALRITTAIPESLLETPEEEAIAARLRALARGVRIRAFAPAQPWPRWEDTTRILAQTILGSDASP